MVSLMKARVFCQSAFGCSSQSYWSEGFQSEESESEAGEETLRVAHESLQDDEELRLHILGLNSFYCKHLVKVCHNQCLFVFYCLLQLPYLWFILLRWKLIEPMSRSGMWRRMVLQHWARCRRDTWHQVLSKCSGCSSAKSGLSKCRTLLTYIISICLDVNSCSIVNKYFSKSDSM